MSIPQYQEFMNPVLEAFSDGQQKNYSTVENFIIHKLKLTKEDISELLPSGTQRTVRNRLSWAIYYLYRSGLLKQVKRGFYEITDLGRKAISKKVKIDNEYLSQFPEYQEFRQKSSTLSLNNAISCKEELDPNTQIENAEKVLKERTKEDLQNKLLSLNKNGRPFENICIKLMEKLNYGIGEKTPISKDGGIDGIISEDALGLDKIYIQAKNYTTGKVHGKEMQNFIGALENHNSKKGVFITTTDFDKNARDMAAKKNIILINMEKLTELMFKYNIGVSIKNTYEIKELDSSYFDED